MSENYGNPHDPHGGHQGQPRSHYMFGYEYKSKLEILGLPLVHVAYGMDPDSGRMRVAKGIIAIGNIALGLIAIGGIGLGGICISGLALGIFCLGGMAISILASLGGLAISGYLALGGLAIAGEIAAGGMAISLNYAFGGFAIAKHPYGGNYQDPLAMEYLRSILGDLKW
jgi:hypothetical protein